MARGWTIADIPDQTGKLAVVTGATSGLGLETARALAGAGASVVLAARDAAKADAAMAQIRAAHPTAKLAFQHIDLASLASVRAAAAALAAAHPAIDLLINNAGLMAIPTRMLTQDGFEMQLGANYFGHYALTALLLPNILAASAPRVISLASQAHRPGSIDFNNLNWERGYTAWGAYSRSKLAMLMFALELDRRARAHGWTVLSAAAHPGWASTNLQTTGLRMGGSGGATLTEIAMRIFEPFLAQNAAAGALPQLYAATSPLAEGGGYYGPDGLAELRGAPKRVGMAPQAKDTKVAARLWDVSAALTGVAWPS